jgi:bisphosphoglycerate-dependent phosphoglycerate mutase
MTELILIRHGETDWNVEGRYQGQADPRLIGRGWTRRAFWLKNCGTCIWMCYTPAHCAVHCKLPRYWLIA